MIKLYSAIITFYTIIGYNYITIVCIWIILSQSIKKRRKDIKS